MAGSSPLQLYSYPTTTDAAGPSSIQTLAQAIEKQVVAIFADTGTRDSRWTAATGLANGAMCFIIATGELQLRSGGAWVVIGGRASAFAMQSSTWNVTTAASTLSGPSSITWIAGRFSLAPVVMLTLTTTSGTLANGANARVANITATGADFYIVSPASNTAGTAVPVDYVAFQMTSTSAGG